MTKLGVVTAVLRALALGLAGCGGGTTDCYHMEVADGIRSNGEACTCTYLYPEPQPGQNPAGPPCGGPECRDQAGNEVNDCTTTPPF